MNTLELNVQELTVNDSMLIEGGLAWYWYAGAFTVGVGLGIATIANA